MSCGLHFAWASANAGISNSGVPTYKIRSRHEFSIHSFGRAALTGADGTVWRRENAGICCMNSGAKFSAKQWENQSAFALSAFVPAVLVRAISESHAKDKWHHEQNPAGRIKRARTGTQFFLRRQRRIPRFCTPLLRHARQRLGIYWRRACHPRLDPDRTDLSFLGHLATDHQHRHDGHYVFDGVPDSEHAEPRCQGNASQIRRADPLDERRAQPACRSRRFVRRGTEETRKTIPAHAQTSRE